MVFPGDMHAERYQTRIHCLLCRTTTAGQQELAGCTRPKTSGQAVGDAGAALTSSRRRPSRSTGQWAGVTPTATGKSSSGSPGCARFLCANGRPRRRWRDRLLSPDSATSPAWDDPSASSGRQREGSNFVKRLNGLVARLSALSRIDKAPSAGPGVRGQPSR